MQQGVPPARRPGGRTNPHPAAVRYARSGRLPKRCTIIGSFQRFSNWSARLDSNQQDSVSGAASRTVCDCIFAFLPRAQRVRACTPGNGGRTDTAGLRYGSQFRCPPYRCISMANMAPPFPRRLIILAQTDPARCHPPRNGTAAKKNRHKAGPPLEGEDEKERTHSGIRRPTITPSYEKGSFINTEIVPEFPEKAGSFFAFFAVFPNNKKAIYKEFSRLDAVLV